MSTKIYTGFRTALSFRALDKLIREFVPVIVEKQREVIAKAVVRLAAFDFDDRATAGLTYRRHKPTTGRFVPAYATRAFLRQLAAEENRPPRDDDDDDDETTAIYLTNTTFTLCLYPQGRHIMGVTFTEISAWHDLWMASAGIEEYGYWNNTDRPDDVSSREWSRRKRAWDAAVGDWRFKDRAYSRELTVPLLLQPDRNETDKAACRAAMPRYAERVRRIARNLCWTDWMAFRQPDESHAVILGGYTQFNKWLEETEEGKATNAMADILVRERLDPFLTVDMLMGVED